MSNPTSVVTERRLGEFYQEILPYLGGSADAGFTPVGSVIAIMGVTAPANYLACNGQIVNVADYPELANYFEQQFGTKYKFGGSGTTFGIPDLRGEFLRGTGTNGHEGQGSGSAVGIHQNATSFPNIGTTHGGTDTAKGYGFYYRTATTNVSSDKTTISNPDSGSDYTSQVKKITINSDSLLDGTNSTPQQLTSRPTNTSILWCIATKDIYLNPSMDYSTSEKVVGKWIDGKTLYQRTIQMNTSSTGNDWGSLSNLATYDLSSIGIDKIINLDGFIYYDNGTRHISNRINSCAGETIWTYMWCTESIINLAVCKNNNNLLNKPAYITIQYTKTT